jgi:catechol 2,3-dioxygenase-like lactoylglutathione lyase family enzyme
MSLPLQLGPLDHYTLIVEDAAATARFHEDVLGFRPLRIQKVNAGTAREGEFDMLNHVLCLPGSTDRVVVVTEGLTENSIFCRYLRKYGPGIHHVAYEVDDIRAAMDALGKSGVRTTATEPHRDPLTGLLQVFLSREPTGYFVELIERSSQAATGVFTNENMAALANTMNRYLGSSTNGVASTGQGEDVCVEIAVSEAIVRRFLLEPLNLALWTGHRMIRRDGVRVVEARMHGDVAVEITQADDAVVFTWSRGTTQKTVCLRLMATGTGCVVSVEMKSLPVEAREQIAEIMSLELAILSATLEERRNSIAQRDWDRLTTYHLEIHQRIEL